MPDEFFQEQEDQSAVKSQIVAKYFAAWARIMANQADRVGYFDFFAGPGRYRSGEKSTPLLILEQAIRSPDLRERLLSVFNDANAEFTETLQEEIDKLENIDSLKHKPQVFTSSLDDDIVEYFEGISMIPALSFIDPWGYKGLSLRLIRAVVKDFGCEVIFFFNYNRINMGITNPIVEAHMEALFGAERLGMLRSELDELHPAGREGLIKRRLGEALEEMGAPHLIPFTFRREDGRVSHYICFVSKHPLGFGIMKEIMATAGLVDGDGVPKFEYMPAWSATQMTFDLERPIEGLGQDLLREFAGETLSMVDVYTRHQVDKPFIRRNYKKVLIELEAQVSVECEPPQSERRANTMADHVMVTFPPR